MKCQAYRVQEWDSIYVTNKIEKVKSILKLQGKNGMQSWCDLNG